MHKLLSLVLSISILVSSITPAMAQAKAGRGVVKGLRKTATLADKRALTKLNQNLNRRVLAQAAAVPSTVSARIVMGNTQGLAAEILNKPAALRAPILRSDFVSLSLIAGTVTPAQRAQAAQVYASHLKHTQKALQVAQTDLPAFLSFAAQNPSHPAVLSVQYTLADASALGIVGTQENAPILLDFYKQAQGTLFEDTAALITARGLLHMQAYQALEKWLSELEPTHALAGVTAYIAKQHLPLTVPPAYAQLEPTPADKQLANFLKKTFAPNRLHADPSVQATEQWLTLSVPNKPQLPAAPTLKTTPAAAPAVSQQPGQTTNPTAARNGVLYSGIPVFVVTDALERFGTWARRKLHQRVPNEGPFEEAGLHESNVRPVFAEVEIPSKAVVGGDLLGVDEVQEVSVGADGFKLTLVREDNTEHILRNVDLTVSNTLKNFSPKYNRLALDKNHIFELRDLTVPAKRPDHFYFTLSTLNGELNTLLAGARQLNLARPMRIKIQRTSAPKKSITLPVYDTNLQEPPVIMAEVDSSLLSGIKDPEKGHIWSYNGSLYFRNKEGETTELVNAFVRLPKTESKYWTQILAMYPQTPFKLGVFSTTEKMVPLTHLVPSLQIGLGKTLAPVLHNMSTLGETSSSAIMLGINNVLPALMGLVHPFLKQYGEAAVFRVGASMFTAGGLIALASGLCSLTEGDIMTHWQLAGFLTSSVLIALGTNITRFVQNLLMSANRGIVPQTNSFQKQPVTQSAQAVPLTYNTKFFLKRGWEVLTKKSNKSLRDVVLYQQGAMYKNLGTMAFLSFPLLANFVGNSLGYNLGWVFSASYVPYTLYSLYTLRKVYQTRYKDAFPLNQTVLQNNLQDVAQAATLNINAINPAELSADHPVIMQSAKKIKAAIDALTPVEARKTKTTINTLTAKHEQEVGEELENMLALSSNYTPEQAKTAREALQQAFDTLGHRNVKLKDVMMMSGLPTALGAMTLATLGELGLSNGLAFAMQELIGNATKATGIVGILLYGCMFGWRIVGNVLSQRMSGGSMYAVSSMASIAGPVMMTLAGSNIGMLATGAMIACFGISNFFSQMYEYMVGLHPKYKREIALLITYTMPAAAIPAALLRGAVAKTGIASLDIAIAGAALAASVALTPGMLANSSMIQGAKYGWKQLKAKLHRFFHRGGNIPPAAEVPAN